MPVLTVSGDLSHNLFHECRLLAEDICQVDRRLQLQVVGLIEGSWLPYLQEKKNELGGKAAEHVSGPFIFHSSFGYIGGIEELCLWADRAYHWGDPRAEETKYQQVLLEVEQVSKNTMAKFVMDSKYKYVYLEFMVGESRRMSPVVIELFVDECPKTCENFLKLCTGEKSYNSGGTLLHYAHTYLHRIVKGGWIQAGDITGKGKGTSGHSIFGKPFEDESYNIKHDRPGIVGMANAGVPHTNGSQFYITMKDMPHFDRKKVAFGQVVMGFDVLQEINDIETQNERPIKPILIGNSGMYNPHPKFNAEKEYLTTQTLLALKKRLAADKERQKLEPVKRKATLLFLGLKGAGTSSIVQNLKGTPDERPTTTNGFELNEFAAHDFSIRAFGVGGHFKIRGIWPNYFEEVHALVFVVDATDRKQLAEAVTELKKIVQHEKMAGKPVLLFANKQDVEDALGYSDILEAFAKVVKKGDAFKVVLSSAKVEKNAEVKEQLEAAVEQKKKVDAEKKKRDEDEIKRKNEELKKKKSRDDTSEIKDPEEEKKKIVEKAQKQREEEEQEEASQKAIEALESQLYKIDAALSEGIAWLLEHVSDKYRELELRVKNDVQSKKKKEKEDKEAKKLAESGF